MLRPHAFKIRERDLQLFSELAACEVGYHDKLKAQIWEQQRLGTKRRYTWREAVVRYIREAEAERKASIENDRHALRWLDTYLRRANVTHLEWSQVDLVRKTAWVLGENTKNGKALAVPLSDKAIEILQAQKALQEKDETERDEPLRWVFAKAGRPVHQTSTRAWREALIRAEICDFCWHDLRHTWASWHVQNGTPLHVLQELGGWSSLKMVQRYAHLSGEHLRHWIDRPKLQLVADNENLRTGTSG